MAKSNKSFIDVLDAVLKNETLYVKGTGIKIFVTDMNYRKGQKDIYVKIRFLTTPTKTAIMKCKEFSIYSRNGLSTTGNQSSATPQLNCDVISVISINNLSTTPYETKAAKTLYKK